MTTRRILWSVALALVLSACGDDDPGNTAPTPDPEPEMNADDAGVEPDAIAEDVAEDVDPEPDPEPTPEPVVPLPVDPDFDEAYEGIEDQAVTTLVQTRQPRHGFVTHVDGDGRPRTALEEFGRVHAQPGEPHALRHQLALPEGLGVDFEPGALPESARSALYSFVIADPQLIDMDSPGQVASNAVRLGSFALPAYEAQAEVVPHLFDALIRTANLFQVQRPFDVVVTVGDTIENGQVNEAGWFQTIMRGGQLSVDSGERDDVQPGPDNDAFDPFVAEGFTEGTPWLQTIGNHDIQVNGLFPIDLITAANNDPVLLEELEVVLGPFGLSLPGVPTSGQHPAFFPHEERAAFKVQMEDFQLDQLPHEETLAALVPAEVMPDPAREVMDVCRFIGLNRVEGSVPEGQGFTAQNAEDCTGWYTHDPVPGVPLRILNLALGPVEGGPQGMLSRPYDDEGEPIEGLVGDPRFDQVAFLEAELARAKEEGVALIIMSHQASGSLATESFLGFFKLLVGNNPIVQDFLDRFIRTPPEPVDSEQFRTMLVDSGVVIAHLAGHNHTNSVRAVCPDGTLLDDAETPCEAGAEGQAGYWEITTVAARAFPHQGRFVEVVHIEGRLAALYTTLLDPHIPTGSFTELGRFITRAESAATNGGGRGTGERSDRNLLLPILLPEGSEEAWQDAELSGDIESETTLLAPAGALPQLPVWP